MNEQDNNRMESNAGQGQVSVVLRVPSDVHELIRQTARVLLPLTDRPIQISLAFPELQSGEMEGTAGASDPRQVQIEVEV